MLTSDERNELLSGEEGVTDQVFDWGCKEIPDLSQAVLFTNDRRILQKLKSRVPKEVSDIAFFDGGEIVKEVSVGSERVAGAGSMVRPMTAVRGQKTL